MYECESWNIKKAECQRIDAFELWCWRRLLRVLGTARRSNQSILKEILNIHWKDWCWSWSSNSLATWCKDLIHWKRSWFWENLQAEGEEGNRGWDGQMASVIQWAWTGTNSRRWSGTERTGMLQTMGSQKIRHGLATEQQKSVIKGFKHITHCTESYTLRFWNVNICM